MKLLIFKIIFIVCLITIPQFNQAQSQLDTIFGSGYHQFIELNDTILVPYRYFIPDSGTAPYPLLMNLHGSGARGFDNTSQLNQGATIIFQSILDIDSLPTVFLAPQLNVNLNWPDYNNGYYLVPIIDSLIQIGLVDSNQIYLIGQSRGASGVVEALKAFPNLITAGIATGGLASYQSSGYFAKPALWYWQGLSDNYLYIKYSELMAANSFAANGEMTATYLNEGHGLTGALFDDDLNERAVINWFYKHHKSKQHTTVQWLQGQIDLDTIKQSTFIYGKSLRFSGNLIHDFQVDSALRVRQISEMDDSSAIANNKYLEACIYERNGSSAEILNINFQCKSPYEQMHVVLAKANNALYDFQVDNNNKYESFIYPFDSSLVVNPYDSLCFQFRFYLDDSIVPTNTLIKMDHISISALSEQITFPVSQKENNINDQWEVDIFPVPSSSVVYIQSNNPYRIDISNLSGKVIHSSMNENNLALKLSSGIYFAKFEYKGQVKVKKILITK
jgi:hypothetical protein